MKKSLIVILVFIGATFFSYTAITKTNINQKKTVGDVVDTLNGVPVYYNGGVGHVEGRNLAKDGYNLGLKYQCVEFVKRYYYDHLGHKMPDSYGHAKSFFNHKLASGKMNKQRNLRQYSNPATVPPTLNDIVVYKGTVTNPYGHVAIVSSVNTQKQELEIIQQNPGPFAPSRVKYSLVKKDGKWQINDKHILGWLAAPAAKK